MELPFQNWQSTVQSFPSTWKQKRDVVTHTTQTDEIINEDKAVQSTALKNSEMQTVTEEERPFSAEEFEKFPPSLFAFFSRATEPVCQYLQQNRDPFGAEVFQDIGDTDSVSEHVEASKEFTLRSEKVPEEFIGSCLAWNKAGSQIAVGYSFPSHDGWCSHKAPVSSWNIRRTQHFQESVPTAEIFLPSCVCCMEYHPMDSSILAVGLYTGEVVLVDLFSIEKGSVSGYSTDKASEDNLDDWGQKGGANSFVADFGYTSYFSGHNCSVVAVKWVRLSTAQYAEILESGTGVTEKGDIYLTSHHCCLLSASKDGFICLWATNRANTRLKLLKKFIVWADNLSEVVKIGNRNINGMKEIGVTGLSCCKDDPFAFIFSTFGSYLFQGNLLSEVQAYEAEAILQETSGFKSETLFSPAPVILGQHEGYTVALDCSPFHRNVFLTATSDGLIFLRNLLQEGPMIKFTATSEERAEEGISDIQWSSRPMMFGVSLGNCLKIFDLMVGESPVVTIENEVPITKIAFNKSETGTVAVTNEKGEVQIWKLPSKVGSLDSREIELFLELVKMQTDT